jgi:hypothetical protein
MDSKADASGMGAAEDEEAGEETPLLHRNGHDGMAGQHDAAFKERIVSATAVFSCTCFFLFRFFFDALRWESAFSLTTTSFFVPEFHASAFAGVRLGFRCQSSRHA